MKKSVFLSLSLCALLGGCAAYVPDAGYAGYPAYPGYATPSAAYPAYGPGYGYAPGYYPYADAGVLYGPSVNLSVYGGRRGWYGRDRGEHGHWAGHHRDHDHDRDHDRR